MAKFRKIWTSWLPPPLSVPELERKKMIFVSSETFYSSNKQKKQVFSKSDEWKSTDDEFSTSLRMWVAAFSRNASRHFKKMFSPNIFLTFLVDNSNSSKIVF